MANNYKPVSSSIEITTALEAISGGKFSYSWEEDRTGFVGNSARFLVLISFEIFDASV